MFDVACLCECFSASLRVAVMASAQEQRHQHHQQAATARHLSGPAPVWAGTHVARRQRPQQRYQWPNRGIGASPAQAQAQARRMMSPCPQGAWDGMAAIHWEPGWRSVLEVPAEVGQEVGHG